jgi:hypothetical protein
MPMPLGSRLGLARPQCPYSRFLVCKLSAQEPPWEGCHAASKIEYESAKRDFLL